MYYQNYEDYMRSVLGYPIETSNTYEAYSVPYSTMQAYTNPVRYSDDVMNLYPEIYKIVNPMVCKICEANTKPITRELIDQMTNEIYLNLEVQPEMDTVVNIQVNTTSNKTETKENRSHVKGGNNVSGGQNRITNETQNKEIKEYREAENRQSRPNNRLLQDLIRILILNQLLHGNIQPPRPPRPPMPPKPQVRPPFPRESNEFYENYLRY